MSSDLKQPLSRGTDNSHGTLSRHDLEDLPVALEHRKFADAAFCLLFSLFCAGMVVLAIYSVASTGGVNGYERLTNGVQFNGTRQVVCVAGAVGVPRTPWRVCGAWCARYSTYRDPHRDTGAHACAEQGRSVALTCPKPRTCTGRPPTSTLRCASHGARWQRAPRCVPRRRRRRRAGRRTTHTQCTTTASRRHPATRRSSKTTCRTPRLAAWCQT